MAGIESIESIKKNYYQSPLFGNKYYLTIDGLNDLGYYVKSITLPSNSYNCKNLYVGGIEIAVPNKFELGQLDMQIYNTGKEYQSIYEWGEQHYKQSSGAYGYVEDIKKNIVVYELHRTGDVALTHTFTNCILYQYGSIQLSYDEASQFEEFQVSVKFQKYSVTASS